MKNYSAYFRASTLDAFRIRKITPPQAGYQTLDTEFGRIRYLRTGDRSRPSVVLMPDPPNTLEHMQGLIEILKTRYDVIGFEAIGFGFSTPSVNYDYSPAHMAQSITRLLEFLSVRRAIAAFTCVAGLSAIYLAKLRPDLVGGLVLGQTPSIPEAQKWLRRVDSRRILSTPYMGQLALRLGEKKIVSGWYKVAFPRDYDGNRKSEHVRSAFASLAQGAFFSLASAFQAIAKINAGEFAGAVDVPAVVLWGEQDRTHRPTRVEDIFSILPRAELRKLPHCGHFPDIEEPAAFAAAIDCVLEKMGRQEPRAA